MSGKNGHAINQSDKNQVPLSQINNSINRKPESRINLQTEKEIGHSNCDGSLAEIPPLVEYKGSNTNGVDRKKQIYPKILEEIREQHVKNKSKSLLTQSTKAEIICQQQNMIHPAYKDMSSQCQDSMNAQEEANISSKDGTCPIILNKDNSSACVQQPKKNDLSRDFEKTNRHRSVTGFVGDPNNSSFDIDAKYILNQDTLSESNESNQQIVARGLIPRSPMQQSLEQKFEQVATTALVAKDSVLANELEEYCSTNTMMVKYQQKKVYLLEIFNKLKLSRKNGQESERESSLVYLQGMITLCDRVILLLEQNARLETAVNKHTEEPNTDNNAFETLKSELLFLKQQKKQDEEEIQSLRKINTSQKGQIDMLSQEKLQISNQCLEYRLQAQKLAASQNESSSLDSVNKYFYSEFEKVKKQHEAEKQEMIEDFTEEKINLEKKLEEEINSKQALLNDMAELNQKVFLLTQEKMKLLAEVNQKQTISDKQPNQCEIKDQQLGYDDSEVLPSEKKSFGHQGRSISPIHMPQITNATKSQRIFNDLSCSRQIPSCSVSTQNQGIQLTNQNPSEADFKWKQQRDMDVITPISQIPQSHLDQNSQNDISRLSLRGTSELYGQVHRSKSKRKLIFDNQQPKLGKPDPSSVNLENISKSFDFNQNSNYFLLKKC